jgi:putative ABC transport system ATP-binding protein
MALSAPHAIELHHLNKQFAHQTVLHDLTLQIPHGQFLALMGRSGSGKSTLLHIIAGLERPDTGEVRVLGEPLLTLDEEAKTRFRREKLGFVFQFFNLLPTLSVLENVMMPLILGGLGTQQATQQVLPLLDAVGLADKHAQLPNQLSGGEMQRVAIARALAYDPPLLLADEPTGNLDADNAQRIMQLLGTMSRERGKTILMVTHSPEAASVADVILNLREGQLQSHTGVTV